MNRLSQFDPREIARYEKDNYVAYYQKDWPKLLRVSVGLVKATYHLSLAQAVYAAFLVARAEIAFAPFPDNDVPRAEASMRRFFAAIRRIHHLEIDVQRAARLEVNWWSVHRRLFGQEENQDLVQALADVYALTYGIDPARVHPAAFHRARGMWYSDLWVNERSRPIQSLAGAGGRGAVPGLPRAAIRAGGRVEPPHSPRSLLRLSSPTGKPAACHPCRPGRAGPPRPAARRRSSRRYPSPTAGCPCPCPPRRA